MPESNLEDHMPVPELTENQKYVNEKIASLLDQIGDEYGESLTQQLVQRLDATVTDFHEEVTNMLSELKEKTVSRQQKLRDAWDHRFEKEPEPSMNTGSDIPSSKDSGGLDSSDSSEWEKRLETMESGKKAGEEVVAKSASSKDKKKKKKGLFGRKKK